MSPIPPPALPAEETPVMSFEQITDIFQQQLDLIEGERQQGLPIGLALEKRQLLIIGTIAEILKNLKEQLPEKRIIHG